LGIFDKVKQIFKIGAKKTEPPKPQSSEKIINQLAEVTRREPPKVTKKIKIENPEVTKAKLGFKSSILKMAEEITGRGTEYYKIEKMDAMRVAQLLEEQPELFDVILEYDLEGDAGDYDDMDWDDGPTEEDQINNFIEAYNTRFGGK
jgi:hypothetical protein